MLGSKYDVSHPFYLLERTLANINLDGFNPFGRGSDIMVAGLGNSTLDDLLETAARGDLAATSQFCGTPSTPRIRQKKP